MTNIKTMMEEIAQEELERDVAACREAMQSRKGAGAHGKMRLIDADAMRQDWLENGENEYVYDTNAVLDSIDAQPTVDAVPVVRCKECEHWWELLDACPNPCGVACWEQYLKYRNCKDEMEAKEDGNSHCNNSTRTFRKHKKRKERV